MWLEKSITLRRAYCDNLCFRKKLAIGFSQYCPFMFSAGCSLDVFFFLATGSFYHNILSPKDDKLFFFSHPPRPVISCTVQGMTHCKIHLSCHLLALWRFGYISCPNSRYLRCNKMWYIFDTTQFRIGPLHNFRFGIVPCTIAGTFSIWL